MCGDGREQGSEWEASIKGAGADGEKAVPWDSF